MDKYRIAHNSTSNSSERPSVRVVDNVNVPKSVTNDRTKVTLSVGQENVSLGFEHNEVGFEVRVETDIILDLWSRFNGRTNTSK